MWQIRRFLEIDLISIIEKLVKRDLIHLEKVKIENNLDLFTEIQTTPFYEEVDPSIKLVENFYYLLIFNLLN
jgi:hypothetical protein